MASDWKWHAIDLLCTSRPHYGTTRKMDFRRVLRSQLGCIHSVTIMSSVTRVTVRVTVNKGLYVKFKSRIQLLMIETPLAAGPKSIHSGNGRPLIALHCLLLMLVSTPLRIANRCWADWLVHRWVYLATGPKSVRLVSGRPLIALRCLLLMLVSTPLCIVNRCCSGFPVSGSI